jgi:two-component system nitrate/nitrite sensor histidine kinase NarX
MQVRPYKTLDNRIDGAVLTLLDIDELKRVLAAQRIVESALRESEARFKIAAEAAFLGVYDYDVAAGVITWDERARQVWGSREQQIGFDDFMTGVHPEDRAGARKAVDEAIDPTGEGRFRATFRVLDDAGVRWVSATGQVLFEEQQPLRLVGTLEDITERRYLEDSVRAAELAAAGQDERNRLARELHDSTTQALFAATLKAEALTTAYDPLPDRAAKTIEELRRLSRGALAQMRTLLLELHDEPLDEIPLEQLLRQLVEAVEGRVGTVTELSVRGAGELPSLVHVTVYRIVQEALNNVSKHADAANAWVLVDLEPGRLHLTVEDDGRGFDPAAVDPGHFGLRSMQERAAEAGAELKIGPRPGGGTVVQVDWTAAADPVV